MRRLIFLFVAVGAALALPGLSHAQNPCGLPGGRPLWMDFGTPQIEDVIARPGLILAVSTGEFPAKMRAAGAKTIYWDMNLRNRVGMPNAPADPATIVDRANRLYEFAAGQTDCRTPWIALNELFGATLETPWTPSNTQYRANVLTLMRTLAERGARPFLLLSSAPYTGSEEAQTWWREAARFGDLVPEVYFSAPSLSKQGPIVASRRLRTTMRRAIGRLTAIGIPPAKIGIVLGFQSTSGGREGLKPASAWFRTVKWQALAAKQVASETQIASVFSWGWASYSAATMDPDKSAAMCVYLWTRDPRLCDGPSAAGPGFDTSLIEGQIRVPAGAYCTVGRVRIGSGDLLATERVTGDREVALSALLARVAERAHATVTTKQVLRAERAVIALRFRGSSAAYRSALGRAGASIATARSVMNDELRRLAIESRLPARRPSASEVFTFYEAYPDLLARRATAAPAAPWLGRKKQGIALEPLAPARLFALPVGRRATVPALDGASYSVRALGPALPLGSVPLAEARPAIAAALASFGRHEAFERWSVGRQTTMLANTTCRADAVPSAGTIRLTSYLPFLALNG